MKRLMVLVFSVILFAGCGSREAPIDKAIHIRESLLASNKIAFHALITADYGEVYYTFEMDCTQDAEGKLLFTVTDPETIAGITGTISHSQSALTFDDKVLAFPSFSDGQVSPVAAPYLFLKALAGGYISACGEEHDGYCIYIDDSYMEKQFKIQIFTDAMFLPVRAEMIYQNQRILSLDISNFSIM